MKKYKMRNMNKECTKFKENFYYKQGYFHCFVTTGNQEDGLYTTAIVEIILQIRELNKLYSKFKEKFKWIKNTFIL